MATFKYHIPKEKIAALFPYVTQGVQWAVDIDVEVCGNNDVYLCYGPQEKTLIDCSASPGSVAAAVFESALRGELFGFLVSKFDWEDEQGLRRLGVWFCDSPKCRHRENDVGHVCYWCGAKER